MADKAVMTRRRTIPVEIVRRVWDRDDGRCQYCGIDAQSLSYYDGGRKRWMGRAHLDHITPLALGGEDTVDNLVVACYRCNDSKGRLSLIVWLAKAAA